ncbi:MAG: hypothetical protein QF414_07580 [Arenicellales bacterium]|nr:hypothetical protein [Arenicellales bacterium]
MNYKPRFACARVYRVKQGFSQPGMSGPEITLIGPIVECGRVIAVEIDQ